MSNLIKILLLLVLTFELKSQGYVVTVDEDIVRRSRIYCEMEMNQKEEGENRGFCEKYLNLLGLKAGNPYCYAGQYWCYEIACREMNKVNPLPRSGLAISVYYWGKNFGVKTTKLNTDAFIVWRQLKTSFGHIERVKSVGRGGWVVTYAFNVNDGTCLKKRNIKYPIGRKVFLGWVNVTK